MKSDARANGKRVGAEETIRRFDSARAAEKYRRALPGTKGHRREVRALAGCLGDVAPGSLVLDFPCGAGRLLPFLAHRGLRLAAADSSLHMVRAARSFVEEAGLAVPDLQFAVADVFAAPYPDGTFDAVVCSRLFHHFATAELRRRALGELARISRGPVVVSFFSSRTVDGLTFRWKHAFSRRPATDRLPIPPPVFVADSRAAGLEVIRIVPVRRFVSKQHYAVLRSGPRA